MKLTTLCYPICDGHVLLAMKKRGFGVGKWNGAGGKVQAGESVEDACRRETYEEIGIEVDALEARGVIEFIFEGKPDWDNVCHVFVARTEFVQAIESEEMCPQWFAFSDVPYAEMWDDDRIWLPGVLSGGCVYLRCFFDGEGKMTGFEEMHGSNS
jgi:8-oxo-dGTP diphosphatase